MSSLTLVLAGIFVLILLNGLFSCMEIALVSVSRARLKRFEQEKKSGATAALFLQKNIDDFFATVQIGITFVGTLSAAIGGESSLELFTPLLEAVGVSPTSSTGRILSLVGITICISYATLVLGELVPKSLARRYPGTISISLAGFFRSVSTVMNPAVKILSASTWAILRLLRIPTGKKTMSLTTEEFRMMALELVETRQIPKSVHDILVQASRLAKTRVEDVMVPRHRIVRVSIESAHDPRIKERILATYKKHPYTNFPVTDAGGEHVLGVVNVKDLLLDASPPSRLLRPVTFAVRGITLDRLLATMQKNDTGMSVVVDEHGVIDGIVTLEDILEEFVGEIEGAVPCITSQRIPSGEKASELQVEGTISLHQLRETCSISLPHSMHYSTLAGFLLEKLGKVPSVGNSLEHDRWRFQVIEMEGNRIKTVKIDTMEDFPDSSDLPLNTT